MSDLPSPSKSPAPLICKVVPGLLPADALLTPAALAEHLTRHGITTLFLTTSLFHQMAQQAPAMFAGLRNLIFGGEAADAHCVRLVLENGKPGRLVNGYGPTDPAAGGDRMGRGLGEQRQHLAAA